MPALRMVLDGTEDREPATHADADRMVFIEGHAASGQPVIGVVLRKKNGELVEGFVTLALFEVAARAFVARADALGYKLDDATGHRVKRG